MTNDILTTIPSCMFIQMGKAETNKLSDEIRQQVKRELLMALPDDALDNTFVTGYFLGLVVSALLTQFTPRQASNG